MKTTIENKHECLWHRYNKVYIIAGNEEVFNGSQFWDMNIKDNGQIMDIPSYFFKHGMTASELKKVYESEKKGKILQELTEILEENTDYIIELLFRENVIEYLQNCIDNNKEEAAKAIYEQEYDL